MIVAGILPFALMTGLGVHVMPMAVFLTTTGLAFGAGV